MIFVIIPVFNRYSLTRECIISLRKQSYKSFKIIVVSDASTDETDEMLHKEFPDVILLKGNGNLWWAGSTNLGVKYVLTNSTSISEDFVLTLNNDLVVLEDYFQKLIDFQKANFPCLVGSVSLDKNNRNFVEFCGIKWNEWLAKQTRIAKKMNFSYEKLKASYNIIESDFLSGRGTLIPLKAFKDLGLYDNVNFPQYAGDDDFSLRAKRNGYKLLLQRDIFVLSHVNETGTNLVRVQYSLNYLKNLFFSIKSPINLKIRYRFAIKNSRFGIFYFIEDVLRIFASLIRGLILQPFTKKSS